MTPTEAKQRAIKALEELSADLAAGRSDRLTAYLETMGRFRSYSWRNQWLIAWQYPDATRVAGFRTWISLGRHVRKGEKGIMILAPMTFKRKGEAGEQGTPDEADDAQDERITLFRPVYVFDIEQTEGEPLPEIAKPQGEPGEWLARLKAFAAAESIEIAYQHVPGTLGTSAGGRITIKPDLDPAYEFDVLAHELAHELLHPRARRREMSPALKETEAQAVSAAVCAAVGLDCRQNSADYIHMAGDPKALSDSLAAIHDAAMRIIGWLTAGAEAAGVAA